MTIETRSSPRARSLWAGVLWLVLAAGGTAAFHVALAESVGTFHMLVRPRDADRYLGGHEGTFYLLFVLLGSLVAGALFRSLTHLDRFFRDLRLRRTGDSPGSSAFETGRLILVTAALVAMLGAFFIAHSVHDYAWFTDDEQVYLMQARLAADLKISEPILRPRGETVNPFIVDIGLRDGEEHWTGVYPVLQPALLAVADWIWRPHLLQFACIALLVFHTGRLGAELFESKTAGWIAAWLCALSPMLIGLGSTLHSTILSATLSVIAARLLYATVRRGHVWPSAALGLVGGAVVLTRPLDGLLVVVTCGLVLLWQIVKSAPRHRRRELAALSGFVAGGLVPLAVLVATNLAITGHPLRGGYWLLEQEQGRMFGFGETMLLGRGHSPAIGMAQTVTTLARLNVWAFAWPISLLPWLIALTTTLRNRTVLLLAGAQLVHLGAYFFFAFGSTHDFGNSYHVWHVPWFAVITGYVIVAGSRRFSSPEAGRRLLMAALGLTLTGLALFWPVQLQRWRGVGRAVWAPIRAASEAAGDRDAIVVWRRLQPRGHRRTWVRKPPDPNPEAPLLWFRGQPEIWHRVRLLHRDRLILRLQWTEIRHCLDSECRRGQPSFSVLWDPKVR